MSFNRKLAFLATALGSMGALAACASFPTMSVAPGHAASAAKTGADGQAAGRNGAIRGVTSQASTIPGIAPTSAPQAPTPPATAEQIAAITTDQPINASLPPQPLAQFLNTAFNDVLKVPYSLGPDIATRNQIITLNAPPATTKRAYLALLQTTLRSYGLVMSIRNGGVVITDEAGGGPASRAGAPVIVRSRSSSATPLAARSVMQIFQLVALQADAVQPLVQNTLGSSVSISVDSAANALVIQGTGRMVANAVDLIHNLDEPAFAGAQVVRLEPLYWSAADYATALQTALQAEGYIASADPLGPKAIMILPMASTSQVLVFAADKTTMARVQYWARELDQPSAVGAQNTTFVYDVQNTSATTLGQMLIAAGAQAQRNNPTGAPTAAFPGAGGAGVNVGRAGQVNNAAGRGGAANANGFGGGALGGAVGANGRAGGGATNGIGGAAPNSTTNALNRNTSTNTQMNASGPSPTGGSITVDDAGNRIVFTGSPSEYAALHTLLQRLDSPTREVLVEVTVAEVTLTDETRAGLDFLFSANHNGSVIAGGTSSFPAPTNGLPGGGIGLGSTGATLGFTNASGDLRADFNAFAENNKVNVLSRPHLTATSGSSAEIEVGDQVPIITSQQAASTTTAGNTDLLQTVQYRQTGVTLTITPIIYGDDRVDITIDQEVANVETNPNTAIGSPIIGSRSVSTTLTLADGRSAVLGGLMQDSYSKDNKGVPFLKDIPVLGQAFRNDDINGAKTELVVLITPFIIRDANDMSNLANQMTKDINKAFQTGRGASYTLTPFALGRDFGIGGPDPIVTGASLQRPDGAPNGPTPTPTVDSPLAPPPRAP